MRVVEDSVGVRSHGTLAEWTPERRASAEAEFTMQQVVALTGVGEHALRFYERMSLLSPIHRQSSSGHRRYSVADISTISTLACLRAAGMSLAQMRQYLALVPQGAEAASQAQVILAEQRRALEEQVRTLRERVAYVDHKLAYWRAVEAHDQQKVDELGRSFAARVRAMAQDHGTPPSGAKE